MTQSTKPDSTLNQAHAIRFELSPVTLGFILLGVVGLWLLVKLLPVICVLILALFLVCALNYPVQFMDNHGVNRTTAIALMFFLVLLSVTVLALIVIHPLSAELSTLNEQLPVLRAQLADYLADIPFSSNLSRWVRDGKYGIDKNNVGTIVTTYSLHALNIIVYALSGIFLALYIMIERDRLRGGLFALAPRSHHVRLSRILLNLETIVGAYIRGQLLLSTMFTIFTFTLLTLMGAENAIVFALFAGISDVLPYIGVLLSVGPAVFAVITHGETAILIVLIAMLIYEECESRFLVPLVYGKQLRLPASVILFSLMVGATLMGPFAALLSLPMAATIMMLIQELRVKLPGENEPEEKINMRKETDRAEKEYERQTEGVPLVESAAIAVKIAEERLKDESTIKS